MTFTQIQVSGNYIYAINNQGHIYVAQLMGGRQITEWELLRYEKEEGEETIEVGAVTTGLHNKVF